MRRPGQVRSGRSSGTYGRYLSNGIFFDCADCDGMSSVYRRAVKVTTLRRPGHDGIESVEVRRHTQMPRRWFDRRFPLGMLPEALPEILERLRGTPARLEDRTPNISRDRLVRRVGGTWSIQENV